MKNKAVIANKILWTSHNMQKDIDLKLDLSPQSKKAMGKNQVEIQELIISQMKSNGQEKIKGEIAVDITVYTAVKTPPRIEKYIKNLLDLLPLLSR